ncbi:MAG: glycosyltransferase family 39 protein [Leptospira sp.]|nr:glycosyltransferase family 39 protein [Leptospira sp.]NCS92776.1 glycosyltransferase family 39 protein [Leptospira sp.]
MTQTNISNQDSNLPENSNFGKSLFTKSILYILLFVSLLPLFLTFPLDLIDIDSSQYAEISRELVESGNPFFIYDNGRKYLDKPILTFWKIAASFAIFGYENFAFRIPAILLTLLSFIGIFKLTEIYSGNRDRAWLAVFLYALSPGLYSMVVDPKIDVYLTAYLILVHCFYYFGFKKNRNYYYLMYLAMGLGFVTKGPIAMVIPAISIGADILFRRDWKRLLEMKLFPGVFLSLLPPLLWCIPLFLEFQTYGPYFFLWIQSFGRFYLKRYNQSLNPMYFYSSFSWAFGIFILPFFYYIFGKIRNYNKEARITKLPKRILSNEYKDGDFVIGFWLFLFLFLISFSRFQLPQYIYWCLPAGAVLGSGYLYKLLNSIASNGSLAPKESRIPAVFLYITSFIFLLASLVIPILIMDVELNYYFLTLLFIGIIIWMYLKASKAVLSLSILLVSVSLFFSQVSAVVYPLLTSYQPAKVIGEYLQKNEPEANRLYLFGIPASKRSYAFYSQRYTKTLFDSEIFESELRKDGTRYLLVQDSWVPKMQEFFGDKIEFTKIKSYPAYKVATPEAKFFLKNKRNTVTNEVILYLAKFKDS